MAHQAGSPDSQDPPQFVSGSSAFATHSSVIGFIQDAAFLHDL